MVISPTRCLWGVGVSMKRALHRSRFSVSWQASGRNPNGNAKIKMWQTLNFTNHVEWSHVFIYCDVPLISIDFHWLPLTSEVWKFPEVSKPQVLWDNKRRCWLWRCKWHCRRKRWERHCAKIEEENRFCRNRFRMRLDYVGRVEWSIELHFTGLHDQERHSEA